jgi:hypothetical protein
VAVLDLGPDAGKPLLHRPALQAEAPRVAPVKGSGVRLDTPTNVVAGFRLEGAPELDLVFGNSQRFRAHVDRFYGLEARMRADRETFSEAVQAALLTVAGSNTACPEAALAENYRRAHKASDSFKKHGTDFEAEYRAIVTLDDLGETAGLTPDYRWRVAGVRERYQNALTDLREMHVALIDQLDPELRARQCNPDALLARAPEDTPKGPDKPANKPKTTEVVEASTATFFIDNRACQVSHRVVVDDMFLGEVAAGARSAFQALTGHHALCLRTPDQDEDCTAPGVARQVYIHDGWALKLHCDSPKDAKKPMR